MSSTVALNPESGCSPVSPPLTPDRVGNFDLNKSDYHSSDVSVRGRSSSSSPVSDFEIQSINSSGDIYFSLPINSNQKKLHEKIVGLGTEFPFLGQKLELDAEDNGESMLSTKQEGTGHLLLGKIAKNEEQVRVLLQKLQLSENEVARMRSELQKSAYLKELVETLQAQLKSAHKEIEMREVELDAEKSKVLVLQKQVVEDTSALKGQIKIAEEDLTTLQAKLGSESNKVMEFKDIILQYERDIADRDHELRLLNLSLCETQENFSDQKLRLENDINVLLDKEKLLVERLGKLGETSKTLEEELRKCEDEKTEMKGLHESREIDLQREVSKLKIELLEREGHVEILNKNLDNLKFNYDMLMAAKDEMNAKVSTITADLDSMDNQRAELAEQLRIKNEDLVGMSQHWQKQVDELRLRVEELEGEVNRQKVEISNGAEEKREAIRQLCFSLDHYRSGYKELYQAFVGYKQQTVMAS
ncbi:hypothetical protein K2173_004938 [Erythroxylum novogranatense]|uniref:Uncharacterized protein n=1 Tax=Erythroxylum novogranatense TaxID=1862640 RepID=A0AAV8TB31_9ROSI|nr:hypothetical protein K2173_004938 [Erythroxylum novogranatense]